MLDYKSSPQRKWIGTGILPILFSLFFAHEAVDNRITGDITFLSARIWALDSSKVSVIVLDAGARTTGCHFSRCAYPQWREDAGKIAIIGLNEKSMVSSIAVDGVKKLSPAVLNTRSRNASIGSVFLLIAGCAMCAHGLVIVKRTREDQKRAPPVS